MNAANTRKPAAFAAGMRLEIHRRRRASLTRGTDRHSDTPNFRRAECQGMGYRPGDVARTNALPTSKAGQTTAAEPAACASERAAVSVTAALF